MIVSEVFQHRDEVSSQAWGRLHTGLSTQPHLSCSSHCLPALAAPHDLHPPSPLTLAPHPALNPFLFTLRSKQKVAETTIAALRWLGARDHTFIYWDEQSRTYQPTPFGKAVLASGLPPETCLVLKVGR